MPNKRAHQQLVYFVHGQNPAYFQEAKFSIVSILREKKTDNQPRILVLTDKPAEFSGWPVDIVFTDELTLRDWLGPQSYTHRQKACAIKYALQYADRSIFVDTDTFFVRSPEHLFDLLESTPWVVDEVEATWGDRKDSPLYGLTSSHLRQHHGISDDLLLINSGVLGARDEAEAFMNRTIQMIDEIFPLAPGVYIIEQFAASIAGHCFAPPAETKHVIKHYYATKLHWRRMLDTFFLNHGGQFSDRLLFASKRLPVMRLRPEGAKRSLFRIAALGLSSTDKRLLRLLYYAANLPAHPYAQSYSLGYLDYFREYSGGKISPSTVLQAIELRPALFSKRSTRFILECVDQLEIANPISGGR